MKKFPALVLTPSALPLAARTPMSRVSFLSGPTQKVKYVYHGRCVLLSHEPDGRVKAVVYDWKQGHAVGRGVSADSAYVRGVMALGAEPEPKSKPSWLLKASQLSEDLYYMRNSKPLEGFTSWELWNSFSPAAPAYKFASPGDF